MPQLHDLHLSLAWRHMSGIIILFEQHNILPMCTPTPMPHASNTQSTTLNSTGRSWLTVEENSYCLRKRMFRINHWCTAVVQLPRRISKWGSETWLHQPQAVLHFGYTQTQIRLRVHLKKKKRLYFEKRFEYFQPQTRGSAFHWHHFCHHGPLKSPSGNTGSM